MLSFNLCDQIDQDLFKYDNLDSVFFWLLLSVWLGQSQRDQFKRLPLYFILRTFLNQHYSSSHQFFVALPPSEQIVNTCT
jgi:hypothetical protein